MADQVERFHQHTTQRRMVPTEDGDWVRYSDYKNLDESYQRMKRARSEALRERDQARKQALEEVATEFERQAPSSNAKATLLEAAAYCREQAEKDGES